MNKEDAIRFDADVLNELKVLVSRGEGQQLEFKRRVASEEKIAREIIALANSSGGTLLVGIGDDKTIPGLKYPEDESIAIQRAVEHIQPALTLHESLISIGSNRSVLQYVIEPSVNGPHFLVNEHGVREYFVRAGDKSIRASREMKEIMKRRKRPRDIRFSYGEHEHLLMQYLATNKFITLDAFMNASGLKKFYASNKLILLVLANVLRITPSERGDQYTLAFTKF
jgi:predicted HTH transcriptional regulator